MLNQLLKNPRYCIPDRLRFKVVQSIETLLDDVNTPPPTLIKAMQVLATLDKLNIEIAKTVMPKRVETTAVKTLSDDVLLEKLGEVLKKLPPSVIKGLLPQETSGENVTDIPSNT